MVSAGTITRKIKKQLRENGMGDLTVRTALCTDAWSTTIFTHGSSFTELDVLFAFQGWNFTSVHEHQGFAVSLGSDLETGI